MLIVLSQADPQVHLLQSVIILAVVGCVSNLMAFAGAHFRIMNVSILVRAPLLSGGIWFEVPGSGGLGLRSVWSCMGKQWRGRRGAGDKPGD